MAEGAELAVVFFSAGGYDFALEASSVVALHPADSTDTADLPSVEALLRLPEAPPGDRRILVLRGRFGGLDRPVVMPATVTLGQLPAASVHPLPTLIRHSISLPAVRALAMLDRQMIILVELLRAWSPPETAPGYPSERTV